MSSRQDRLGRVALFDLLHDRVKHVELIQRGHSRATAHPPAPGPVCSTPKPVLLRGLPLQEHSYMELRKLASDNCSGTSEGETVVRGQLTHIMDINISL
jgi:hypothetical protein